jgi:hypothetical protein
LVTLLVGHDAITCGLLLVSCCYANVTLIVDLCHEFCVMNLDGPLSICSKEEPRAVICCLWAEDIPGAKMHRRRLSGSFLMLNVCAIILEPLDPFIDHPL